jgi:hypothetical protein
MNWDLVPSLSFPKSVKALDKVLLLLLNLYSTALVLRRVNPFSCFDKAWFMLVNVLLNQQSLGSPNPFAFILNIAQILGFCHLKIVNTFAFWKVFIFNVVNSVIFQVLLLHLLASDWIELGFLWFTKIEWPDFSSVSCEVVDVAVAGQTRG